MCHYLHIRFYDLSNTLELKPSNKGGVSVAYDVSSDGETVRYAVARCSKNDNFCRKTGRTLATGRLKSDRLSVTLALEGRNPEEALRSLITL